MFAKTAMIVLILGTGICASAQTATEKEIAAKYAPIFHQALGVVFPELFRFFPMTLLILTAMFSCYLQFYAMIRFRLAR